MKREELKAYGMDDPAVGDEYEMYKVAEVDSILEENAAEIEDLLRQNRELCQALQVMYSKEEYGKLQKEIESLKAKLESVQASAYADSVDAGMRERRLRRALYKACANWALSTLAWLDCIDQGEPRKWSEMIQKCRAKAEEYK